MLNATALTEVLRNAVCTGINNIFLFNKEGMLLASAKNVNDAKTMSAVLSNVWQDYEEIGERCCDSREPSSITMQGENGTLLLSSVTSLIIAIQGEAPLGQFYLTMRLIVEALERPLRSLFNEEDS